jgi:hypothetical protein
MKKADGIVGRFSQAAGNAMRNVAIAGTAAAVAIGVDGVKAYIEDEAAARKLAVTLDNVTNATDKQKQGVEEWITKTQFATGVADDQLRPAMARLLRSTGDVTKAQKLLSLGLDISAGTGKNLDTVVAALGKSADGNNASLGRLGLGLDAATLKEGSFSDITQQLRKDFKGFAEEDANTMEGKLKRLNIRWVETKESIGGILLEGLTPLMDWFQTAEGEEAILGFTNGLTEAFQTVAELIPVVIDGLKTLGGWASGLNINFSDIMSPEMIAAAAAFRVALPLGLPAATLAGVTAWAVAHDAVAPPKKVGAYRPDLTLTEMYNNKIESDLTKSPFEFRNQSTYGRGKYAFSGTSVGYAPVYNVVINGAVDPVATSVTVQKAIAKANRMGVNGKIQGMGLGN